MFVQHADAANDRIEFLKTAFKCDSLKKKLKKNNGNIRLWRCKDQGAATRSPEKYFFRWKIILEYQEIFSNELLER